MARIMKKKQIWLENTGWSKGTGVAADDCLARPLHLSIAPPYLPTGPSVPSTCRYMGRSTGEGERRYDLGRDATCVPTEQSNGQVKEQTAYCDLGLTVKFDLVELAVGRQGIGPPEEDDLKDANRLLLHLLETVILEELLHVLEGHATVKVGHEHLDASGERAVLVRAGLGDVARAEQGAKVAALLSAIGDGAALLWGGAKKGDGGGRGESAEKLGTEAKSREAGK